MSCGWRLATVGVVLSLAACTPNRAPVVERAVQDARVDPLTRNRPAAAPASPPASSTASASAPPQSAATAAAPAAKPRPSAPAPRAPVANGQGDDWRPETYTVRPGDTLYAIALDHGQDYRDISAWSELADPNLIHVGQILRVKAPPGWSERAVVEPEVIARPMQPAAAIQATPLEAVPPPPLLKTPKAVKQPYSEQALAQLRGLPYKPPPAASPPATAGAPRTSPGTSAASASLPLPPRPPSAAGTAPATAPPASAPATPPQGTVIAGSTATRPAPDTAAPPQAAWAWPARGRLLHGFNAGPNPKGIVISGELGQPVWASAAGKVVYSGSGLRGYGKLIIVKHDKTYLSVYAHNRELLVKEGEQVVKGQKIAEMGNSESNRVALHFEIRRLGKPVDPLQYLTPL